MSGVVTFRQGLAVHHLVYCHAETVVGLPKIRVRHNSFLSYVCMGGEVGCSRQWDNNVGLRRGLRDAYGSESH